MNLYQKITAPKLLVRRVTITANSVFHSACEQFDLFSDPIKLEREKNMQKAMLGIRKKYGKNAVLKGTNYLEGATTRERNAQIGGHRA